MAKKAASKNRNWDKFTSDEIKRIEQPGNDFKTSIFSKINEVIIFLRTENCGGKTGQNKTRLSNRNAGNEEKLYKNVNQNSDWSQFKGKLGSSKRILRNPTWNIEP